MRKCETLNGKKCENVCCLSLNASLLAYELGYIVSLLQIMPVFEKAVDKLGVISCLANLRTKFHKC